MVSGMGALVVCVPKPAMSSWVMADGSANWPLEVAMAPLPSAMRSVAVAELVSAPSPMQVLRDPLVTVSPLTLIPVFFVRARRGVLEAPEAGGGVGARRGLLERARADGGGVDCAGGRRQRSVSDRRVAVRVHDVGERLMTHARVELARSVFGEPTAVFTPRVTLSVVNACNAFVPMAVQYVTPSLKMFFAASDPSTVWRAPIAPIKEPGSVGVRLGFRISSKNRGKSREIPEKSLFHELTLILAFFHEIIGALFHEIMSLPL
jgi:hypothetical protein